MATKSDKIARSQARRAMSLYHRRYRNGLYIIATDRKSTTYANALTDEALALCGHPYYKLSRRNWGLDAEVFLRTFTW